MSLRAFLHETIDRLPDGEVHVLAWIAARLPVARLAEGLRAEQVAGATQREQHARAMVLRTMRAVAALAGVKLPTAADLAGVHVPAKPPHTPIDALPFDLGDKP